MIIHVQYVEVWHRASNESTSGAVDGELYARGYIEDARQVAVWPACSVCFIPFAVMSSMGVGVTDLES